MVTPSELYLTMAASKKPAYLRVCVLRRPRKNKLSTVWCFFCAQLICKTLVTPFEFTVLRLVLWPQTFAVHGTRSRSFAKTDIAIKVSTKTYTYRHDPPPQRDNTLPPFPRSACFHEAWAARLEPTMRTAAAIKHERDSANHGSSLIRVTPNLYIRPPAWGV